MLDSHDLCSRKDAYRAIPADTDLGFNGLIRGTDSFLALYDKRGNPYEKEHHLRQRFSLNTLNGKVFAAI